MSIYGKPLLTGAKVDSASGPIVSVNDALAAPLRSLLVNIDPVQDLHGYDNPWPAGGGKNKFDMNFLSATGVTIQNGEASGLATAFTGAFTSGIPNLSIPSGQIVLSVDAYTDGDQSTDGNGLIFIFRYSDSTSATAITIANSVQSYTRYSAVSAAGKEVSNISISYVSKGSNTWHLKNIQLESGSSATSYAPYSNICPISGWSAVNVCRTGVNVWDEEWELGTFLNTNGTKYPSTTKIRSKNPIPVKPNTTYYYYVGSTSADEDRIWCYDADMNFIRSFSYTHQTTIGAIFTTPANCSYINFAIKNTTYNNDISINYPSTDHDYHPYSGNQYTIQLGQTVYGGTLDVTNGVLTVDRAMVTFDGSNDEAWNDYSNYNGYYIQLNAMKSGNRQDGWSNMLKDSKTSAQGQIGAMWLGVNNSKNFFVIGVHDTMGATLSVFRSYLSEHPLELVYPLATPITIPLTPTQISTLQGQNNVWADSGDVTVEYLKRSLTYIS